MISNVNFDLVIVVGFLLTTLIIGMRYGQNVKTLEDYALGGRKFSIGSLVATLVATWISGSVFVLGVTETYTKGIHFIVINLIGNLLSFFIIAFLFVPKMKEYIGTVSVASAMYKLYGKEARLITAICGIIGVSGYAAVQFKINADVFGYLLNTNSNTIVICTGFIVAIYSAFGGIKSVTFTDIVQFTTFGVILPGIAFSIWGDVSGIDSVIDFVSNDKKLDYNNLSFIKGDTNYSDYINALVFITFPWLTPAIFQRISMAKNIIQAKRSFVISAFICLFINILISWIAILILVKNSKLEVDHILPYIMENHSFLGLKGLIAIGVTAMVMSTIDSLINSSSVLFANDICADFKLSEKYVIAISRFFAILIVISGLYLALINDNLVSLLVSSVSFYGSLVSVPLILSILGFRSTKLSFIIGFIASLMTILIWKVLGFLILDSVIPGMLSNLIFFIGSHYLLKQEGGWYKNKFEQKKLSENRNFFYRIKKFEVLKFYNNHLPKKDSAYIFLGIFCIISIFSSMFSMPTENILQYKIITDIIFHSVLLITTALLLFPLWSKYIKYKSLLFFFWFFSLFYALSFSLVMQVLMSNFAHFQVIVFLLGIMVISVMTKWQMAIFLNILGMGISFFVFGYICNNETILGFSSFQFMMFYILLMVVSILVFFLKPKQKYLEETETKVENLESEVTHLDHKLSDANNKVGTMSGEISSLNEKVDYYSERVSDQEKEIERLGSTAQRILNNVNHELRLPIGNVMNFSEMLYEGVGKLSPENLKMMSEGIYQDSTRLSTMILNMLDLAMLSAKEVKLNKKKTNLSETVETRVKLCRNVYLQDKPINFKLTIDPEVLIDVDTDYIRQVIDNIVINSINFSDSGLIEVILKRYKDYVELTIKDEGKGIPQTELFDVFDPFKMGSNTMSKAHGRGVGLALCKAAIEAHSGAIKAMSDGEKGATFRIILPFLT